MTIIKEVIVDGMAYPVTISDDRKALQAAAAAGRAVVGIWVPGGEYGNCRYLVTRAEDADQKFLERAVRRHLHLPWIIADTERLRIREFSPDDPLEPPSPDDGDGVFSDEEKRLAYLRNQYEFCECGFWALVCRENGSIIGKAGITGGELGYHIYEPYRRKGYALEACRAIVEYAWDEMKLEELTLRVRRENAGSIRLAHRLGFQKEEEDGDMMRMILKRPQASAFSEIPRKI